MGQRLHPGRLPSLHCDSPVRAGPHCGVAPAARRTLAWRVGTGDRLPAGDRRPGSVFRPRVVGFGKTLDFGGGHRPRRGVSQQRDSPQAAALPGGGGRELPSGPRVERGETPVNLPIELRQTRPVGHKRKRGPPPPDQLVDPGQPLDVARFGSPAGVSRSPPCELGAGPRQLPVEPVEQLPP